jgi:hypothetical protein
MRPIYTLSFSLLLACGPLAPPLETTTAANSDTLDSGETTQSATTIPDPTTRTTTTDAATSEPTGEPTSSPAPDTSAFIVKLDTPVLEDCDIWAQNCPQGSKCTPWAEGGGGAWNATKCVDITGDNKPGDPCTVPEGGATGIDDCALGSLCWDVAGATLEGTCIAQCSGSIGDPMCPHAT